MVRSAEVDRSGKVWLYTPARHKTLHFGRKRSVPLGPKAQELLAPFLLLDPQAPLFSPKRAEAERHAAKEGVRMSEARARTSLFRLMVLFGVVVPIAIAMVIFARHNAKTSDETGDRHD